MKKEFLISGMTCTSCEVIIERSLSRVPGVRNVEVKHQSGRCVVETDEGHMPNRITLNDALESHGYTVGEWSEKKSQYQRPSFRKQLREFGVVILIMIAVYMVLKTIGIFNFTAPTNDSVNGGTAFIVGLIAATSTCVALIGGLLLSVSSTLNQMHPNATRMQRLRPHILFNIGRLVSYVVLGGVVGLLGTSLSPSPLFSGVLSILIAMVMVLLAVDILKLFPTARWIPRMPKGLSHKMYALAESKNPMAPLLLGAATFFLPCGFTQSMQLYALTTGSFWAGAFTMGMFALGTLPALLGIGVLATSSSGGMAKRFTKIAGATVLLLGLYNINSGLALVGINTGTWFGGSDGVATAAEQTGGVQVVNMAVQGINYIPDAITIQKGVPVEWRIDASKATGCTSVLVVRSLGISKTLSYTKETIITFTPDKVGTIPFTCGMGMAYGEFTVVESLPAGTANASAGTAIKEYACDPTVQACDITDNK